MRIFHRRAATAGREKIRLGIERSRMELAGAPVDQAPGRRPIERETASLGQYSQLAGVLIERFAGDSRVVVVRRIKELVGRIFDQTLGPRPCAEWKTWHLSKLVRSVDHESGNATFRRAG